MAGEEHGSAWDDLKLTAPDGKGGRDGEDRRRTPGDDDRDHEGWMLLWEVAVREVLDAWIRDNIGTYAWWLKGFRCGGSNAVCGFDGLNDGCSLGTGGAFDTDIV